MKDWIDIVFDGPPNLSGPRFIEAQNPERQSIDAGEWIERDDEFWVLRIPRQPTLKRRLARRLREFAAALDKPTEGDA